MPDADIIRLLSRRLLKEKGIKRRAPRVEKWTTFATLCRNIDATQG